MTRRAKYTSPDEFVAALDYLDIYYVLLVDGDEVDGGDRAYGLEGLFAVHLIANALYEQGTGGNFTDTGTWRPRAYRKKPRRGTSKLADVERLVSRMKESGLDFVLCYHVDDDPGWYMAWSPGLSREEAMNRAFGYMAHSNTDIAQWCWR